MLCYAMLCYAKSLQSCPTLCDPVDGSPPGSAIPGILQARTLEWVAISFSNAWKWKVKAKSLSRVQPSATPWTAAYQAPLSWGFSRQEYWSGVPLPSPFKGGRFRQIGWIATSQSLGSLSFCWVCIYSVRGAFVSSVLIFCFSFLRHSPKHPHLFINSVSKVFS